MAKRVWLVLLCCWWGCAAWAQGLRAVPFLQSPVMDTAAMMSAPARADLERHLLQYSAQKGSQIVVLTVPQIAPETPFDYAARVMGAWRPGRSAHDDGVLLLLVRDERKTFLAVGRGLEGAIPDVYAKRLLDDVLRPHLREGDVDKGIAAVVGQIERLIAGEELPEAAADAEADEGLLDSAVLLFIGSVAAMVFRNLFGRWWGGVATGAVAFGLAWLGGLGWGVALFCAFGAAVLVWSGYVFGGRGHSGGFEPHSGSRGGRSGDGWGGGRGKGRSGGGFRGGGGGFGGGASGGW